MPSQRIVRLFGCLLSLKSYQKEQRSLSPTDMTAAKPLNEVRQFVRSSQLLNDIKYRLLQIQFCVAREFHIGVYLRCD